MPVSFSDEQKIKLKAILKKKGSEFFSSSGLKKTSIDELAAAAHISKGSFYSFFKSKEELFFEILNDLENDFQEPISKILNDPDLPPAKALEEALLLQLKTVRGSPLLLSLFRSETIAHLMLKLPPETIEAHMAEHHIRWNKWLTKHKKNLIIKSTEIPAACEAFDNLYFILLHQKAYEKNTVDPMEILIKSFCRGLFKTIMETNYEHD